MLLDLWATLLLFIGRMLLTLLAIGLLVTGVSGIWISVFKGTGGDVHTSLLSIGAGAVCGCWASLSVLAERVKTHERQLNRADRENSEGVSQ